MIRFALLLAMALLMAFADRALAQPAPTTRPSMKVMSFNIRNGGAPDGDNAWPKRRELFFQTIRAFDPDLLGMQEVLHDQLLATKDALPEYDFVGVARENGKEKGEYAPLFYRRDRYELIETGTWWLSPTPDKVASVGWDAALTRIATWTRLRDKSSGEALLIINTHFDHIGAVARHESARLLRAKTEAETGRAIVMGDFNCHETDLPYQVMTEGGVYVDGFRTLHPTPGAEESSFHGFSGATAGKRIDFIFTRGFTTTEATIDRTRDGTRCPSDHDAVTATVK